MNDTITYFTFMIVLAFGGYFGTVSMDLSPKRQLRLNQASTHWLSNVSDQVILCAKRLKLIPYSYDSRGA
jgi:hypothetical protein